MSAFRWFRPAAARLLRRAWPAPALLTFAVVLLAAGIEGASLVRARQQQQFPHRMHAGLFPFCTGCHEGIETGDTAAYYPAPELCGRCHDGEERDKVTYTGPTKEITNLQFTHEDHVSTSGEDVACEQCHAPQGAPRMTVQRAVPAQCLACHGHPAKDHYVEARCATCHVPLARTKFTAAMVEKLPVPADHDAPAFLPTGHGEGAAAQPARCATCHARQQCAGCHVDPAIVAAIGKIPEAPPTLAMIQLSPSYPVPPSHRVPEWLERHGAGASRQECATCHTRDDCAACHVPPLPTAAAALAERPRVAAPGVGLKRQPPLSHAPKSFQTDHAVLAAAQPQQCESCHTRRFCSDCHDAPATPGFHPRNFVAQHASAAYGQRLECATCHETRTFCRSCHIQQGMRTEGRLEGGFHDAQPVWLLRHAQAARQGLESCTSCHTQKDCLQCHSQLGSFGINPHGPNFDAARAQKRNPLICLACHVSDPLKKGTR
ncbi:MAG: hypothetical protein FIB01_03755 [Gemmatimonadetes bacterium]|nr:hypothetical protein [Gemmatimonadota bacterium]